MGPVAHTVISSSIGLGVWAGTDYALALPAAIATGVFIDSDHALDFFDWWLTGYRRYALVLLHGWEYAALALAVLASWSHPLVMAAALGYLGHLTCDQLANRTHPLAYFLVYRIWCGFRYDRLVKPQWLGIAPENVPLWGHVEPWLWRLVHTRGYLLRRIFR